MGDSFTNPFEDPDAEYLALVNEEGQYSLWPVFMDVPAGWTVARPAGSYQDTLDYIEATWTDMRPKSIREHSVDGKVIEHSVDESVIEHSVDGNVIEHVADESMIEHMADH